MGKAKSKVATKATPKATGRTRKRKLASERLSRPTQGVRKAKAKAKAREKKSRAEVRGEMEEAGELDELDELGDLSVIDCGGFGGGDHSLDGNGDGDDDSFAMNDEPPSIFLGCEDLCTVDYGFGHDFQYGVDEVSLPEDLERQMVDEDVDGFSGLERLIEHEMLGVENGVVSDARYSRSSCEISQAERAVKEEVDLDVKDKILNQTVAKKEVSGDVAQLNAMLDPERKVKGDIDLDMRDAISDTLVVKKEEGEDGTEHNLIEFRALEPAVKDEMSIDMEDKIFSEHSVRDEMQPLAYDSYLDFGEDVLLHSEPKVEKVMEFRGAMHIEPEVKSETQENEAEFFDCVEEIEMSKEEKMKIEVDFENRCATIVMTETETLGQGEQLVLRLGEVGDFETVMAQTGSKFKVEDHGDSLLMRFTMGGSHLDLESDLVKEGIEIEITHENQDQLPPSPFAHKEDLNAMRLVGSVSREEGMNMDMNTDVDMNLGIEVRRLMDENLQLKIALEEAMSELSGRK